MILQHASPGFAGSPPPARRSRRAGFVDVLTAREATILSMIVSGATNREAALSLGISPRTVEFHRANIMQKSGARNLAELMLITLGGPIELQAT
jgi:FixJ family two-component response regulator